MDGPLRLVCSPSSDRIFAHDAERLAARIPANLGSADAIAWFQAELRHSYPTAVVREQDELARTDERARTWYVSRRVNRSRISTEVSVPLPQESAYWTYVRRVVDWQISVDLTPLGLPTGQVGDEYEASYSFLGRRFVGRFRILAAHPPHSVAMEAEGSGISVWYITRFLPEGDATRVAVEGDYDLPEGLIPRIADRLLIERAIARDIDRANEAYRLLCESMAGESEAAEGGGT